MKKAECRECQHYKPKHIVGDCLHPENIKVHGITGHTYLQLSVYALNEHKQCTNYKEKEHQNVINKRTV